MVVAEPYGRMIGKIRSDIQNTPIPKKWSKRECTVTSKGFCRQPAVDCAYKLVQKGDIEPVVDAIDAFLQELLSYPRVDAAAFVEVREPTYPASLSVQVFAPLEGEIVDAVANSAGKLDELLSSFLHIGVRIANTSNNDLVSVKQKISIDGQQTRRRTCCASLISSENDGRAGYWKIKKKGL